MMPRLGISQMQLGWLEMAMIIGYTVLQFPGGLLGQRLGARLTFVVIGLIAFAATLATPLLPWVLAGTALFVALLIVQFVLGAAQGPIFPVCAGVFEAWFRPEKWSLVQGVQSMGLQLGAALAPPLIASLMLGFGWQRALFWTSLAGPRSRHLVGLLRPQHARRASGCQRRGTRGTRPAPAGGGRAAHYLAAHRRRCSGIATCCCSRSRTCA